MDAWDGETITEGYRALNLFTDRAELGRLYLGYLNDDPTPSGILFLHGDGGNGKSLLLDYLRTRLCKRIRPENWVYLATLSDVECIKQIEEAEDIEPVPIARLDFSLQGTRDGFEALLKLRRDLSDSGLPFPLFDFAVVTYLHKSHLLTEERLSRLFPAEEMSSIVELAGLVTGVPAAALVTAVLNLMQQHLGERFQMYRLRRNLDEARVQEIQWMDHETQLIQHLPRLFAEDLNAGVGDSDRLSRVAFFFDTHEAFWGHERELVGDLYYGRDEWLRRLLGILDRTNGIVVIVAGREPPRWDQAPTFPFTDLDVRHVSDLSDADALVFLERAGVQGEDLRRQLCEEARVAPDQVHPFYLGLGADLALAAARRGKSLTQADLELGPEAGNHRRRLVDRLLRYVVADVRDAVYAVAVCRSFNSEIYRYLAEELEFHASRSGFETLTRFSFVRHLLDDQFRIHDLLRRLERDEVTDYSRRASEAMEQYYRKRFQAGDELAIVDAIYHANRIEWQRGAVEWIQIFHQALQDSRFDLCSAFLEIRDELESRSDAVDALLYIQEAEFLHRLARYDEARSTYEKALEALDHVLRDEPGMTAAVMNDKGNVLVKIGGLEVALGNEPAAKSRYQDAIASFDTAVEKGALNYQLVSNRGNALVELGDLHARSGDRQGADHSYRRALAMMDLATQIGPREPGLLSNLGTTLSHIGNNLAWPKPRMVADRYYRFAITVFQTAIRLSPRDQVLYNNLGSALHNRGRLYARQRRRKPAERYYRMAIRAADQALRRAPDYLLALSNKGMYCEELGWRILVWARPHRIPDARQLYQEALDAYAKATEIAPNNVDYRTAMTRLRNRLSQIS